MQKFETVREAKEFLVRRVADEATRTEVPLSDLEEKMMYFTETGWTLPEMDAVNAAFEANHDQSQYEEKIAALIRSLRLFDRSHNSASVARWNAAEQLLREEDHYLVVLIDVAEGRISTLEELLPESSNNRFAKLMLYGFIGFIICALAVFVSMRLFP